MQRIDPTKKELAENLRRQGKTLGPIMEATGISRASLLILFKRMELTLEEKALLQQSREAVRLESSVRLVEINKAILAGTRAKNPTPRKKYGKKRPSQAKYTPEERRTRKAQSAKRMTLTYKANEIGLKATLEKLHKQVFHKEPIENVIIPYASKKSLIFVVQSEGMAVHTVKRMAIISSIGDPRKRVVYLNRLGSKAEARLRKLRVDVRPISALGLPMSSGARATNR